MHAVPDPGEPLAALPAPVRAEVDAPLTLLTPPQRLAIAARAGDAAGREPLLHLAAGGEDPEAYFALAAGAAAVELWAVHLASRRAEAADVVRGARELARRAAARFVRDRVIAVATERTFVPGLCDQIGRAAVTLDDEPLLFEALRAAAELDRSAPRLLALCEAAARQLRVSDARAALDAARALAPDDPGLAEASDALDLAHRVRARRGEPQGLSERLAGARALCRLGRFADADRLLEPVAQQADRHLGLATVLALARLGGSTCPGAPPGSAPDALCAAAWTTDPRVAPALALLERAWQSEQGRDAAAVEVYLGLVEVIAAGYRAQRPTPAALAERFRSLQRSVQSGVQAAPELAGLELTVDASLAGFDAMTVRQPGMRPRVPDPILDQLSQRAAALAERMPADRFVQAAVLEVLGLMTQERDILPLLGHLPERLPSRYGKTRALLRLWSAVARQRADVAEQARSELLSVMVGQGEGSLERARAVLAMAESEAALAGQAASYAKLERVAGQLVAADVPPELRLRAAIDQAGCLARAGRRESAGALLATVLGSIDPGAVRELSAVADGYRQVLRARGAPAAERRAIADALERAPAEGVPPGAVIWLAAWVRALRGERPLGVAEIESRVGPEAARLQRARVLSTGSVLLRFAFSGETGLAVDISFDPLFLAVEYPD
jgi:hypothetical protein